MVIIASNCLVHITTNTWGLHDKAGKGCSRLFETCVNNTNNFQAEDNSAEA